MIPAAVDDYLSGLLAGWCTSVARWQPPGRTASTTCLCRTESPFLGLVDAAEWPHELVHELASRLDGAVRELAASFGGDRRSRDDATRIVLARLTRTAPELVDVLEQCVTPRMRRFALRESRRGIQILEEAR